MSGKSQGIWRWMISGNPAVITLMAHLVHISYIGMSHYGSLTHVLQFCLQQGLFSALCMRKCSSIRYLANTEDFVLKSGINYI